MKRRGLLLILSSPSGAGKTSLCRALLAAEPQLKMSVSYTTRPKRPSEEHGKDYYFVEDGKFQSMVQAGDFLEHAKVFGFFYGTPKEFVEQELQAGFDIAFDIDWQGTQQLSENAKQDIVRVFILPPSATDLKQRLVQRAEDSSEVVTYRMGKAADEMSHWAEYDYVVVNDEFQGCLGQLRAILCAERLKRRRQIGLSKFVDHLRLELES